MMDKKANIFKVRYLTGMIGRKCGGHKCGGDRALPGEICMFASGYRRRKAAGWACRSQPRA